MRDIDCRFYTRFRHFSKSLAVYRGVKTEPTTGRPRISDEDWNAIADAIDMWKDPKRVAELLKVPLGRVYEVRRNGRRGAPGTAVADGQ